MHIKPIINNRFKELQSGETFFILHTTQNKDVIILASMKYLGRLWHNILEPDIVRHNHVEGLKSRGSYIVTTIWFFIVILKKSCWMSSVETDNISSMLISLLDSIAQTTWEPT
jgi:hypothetical protein